MGKWTDGSYSLMGRQNLQDLADELPDFLLKSKAQSTKKKYESSFKSWSKWCLTSAFIKPIPATEYFVALYLLHLSKTANTISTVNDAMYAISWAHQLAGFPDPTKSFLVKTVRESADRTIVHIVNKKEPITPHTLFLIVQKYAHETASLLDLRLATMCLVSYAGFLRFSELANIKRSDIVFNSDHIVILIKKSKTDKYNIGF